MKEKRGHEEKRDWVVSLVKEVRAGTSRKVTFKPRPGCFEDLGKRGLGEDEGKHRGLEMGWKPAVLSPRGQEGRRLTSTAAGRWGYELGGGGGRALSAPPPS